MYTDHAHGHAHTYQCKWVTCLKHTKVRVSANAQATTARKFQEASMQLFALVFVLEFVSFGNNRIVFAYVRVDVFRALSHIHTASLTSVPWNVLTSANHGKQPEMLSGSILIDLTLWAPHRHLVVVIPLTLSILKCFILSIRRYLSRPSRHPRICHFTL